MFFEFMEMENVLTYFPYNIELFSFIQNFRIIQITTVFPTSNV